MGVSIFIQQLFFCIHFQAFFVSAKSLIMNNLFISVSNKELSFPQLLAIFIHHNLLRMVTLLSKGKTKLHLQTKYQLYDHKFIYKFKGPCSKSKVDNKTTVPTTLFVEKVFLSYTLAFSYQLNDIPKSITLKD